MILYNMASGVLRAFGILQPLYILLVSSIINIVGDILLVGGLGMEPQVRRSQRFLPPDGQCGNGTVDGREKTAAKDRRTAAPAAGAGTPGPWHDRIPLALQSVLFLVANSIVQAGMRLLLMIHFKIRPLSN